MKRIIGAALLVTYAFSANAQLKGDNVLGDMGLQSGTQTSPSLSIAVPLYFYTANKYKLSNGNSFNTDFNMFFTGIVGSVVTNFKILGANYGASVVVPFASNRLEGNLVNSKSNFNFTDMYVQPVQLGWHVKQADFLFGYAMFIPTGKYKFLEDGNAGLGMLVNELSGGSTVFFDKKKTFSFSALAAFEVHSKKKHTDIKTGDILSVEGGLGKTWYKKVKGSPIPMIFNAGAIYFFQQKLTSDKIPVGTTVFTGSKDHVWGIGAEGSMFIPKARINITARWLKDVGARNRTDGNTFFVMVAYMIKSFAKH